TASAGASPWSVSGTARLRRSGRPTQGTTLIFLASCATRGAFVRAPVPHGSERRTVPYFGVLSLGSTPDRGEARSATWKTDCRPAGVSGQYRPLYEQRGERPADRPISETRRSGDRLLDCR